MIMMKRAYEPWSKEDGYRLLVDRMWPRGVSREEAHIDMWLKEIAPSAALRKWFGHDPEKWDGFREKYRAELEANAGAAGELGEIVKRHKKVTLVYAAKDEAHNNAVVLRDWLSR